MLPLFLSLSCRFPSPPSSSSQIFLIMLNVLSPFCPCSREPLRWSQGLLQSPCWEMQHGAATGHSHQKHDKCTRNREGWKQREERGSVRSDWHHLYTPPSPAPHFHPHFCAQRVLFYCFALPLLLPLYIWRWFGVDGKCFCWCAVLARYSTFTRSVVFYSLAFPNLFLSFVPPKSHEKGTSTPLSTPDQKSVPFQLISTRYTIYQVKL